MENKNIIIILLVVVIILAIVAGVMITQQGNAKEPTKIKITSDKSQYEGGKLSIKLTDLNKSAISKQKVKVIVKNKKGKVVVNKTVKTNSKGNAKAELDLKKGEYKVKATYNGNENYTGNNTTQKLKIKEHEVTSTDSSSQGWTTVSSGGDTGSKIVTYHDGKGHKYVTRYSADGSCSEDGIAYDEDAMITS